MDIFKDRLKRLSEKTRFFAYESLNHKYGIDTLTHSFISLDNIKGFKNMSPIEKYDTAVLEIV